MSQLKKSIFIILGTFFVLLGVIGIILPVVPTTPFLIIAGAFYIKSSKTLYKKLINLKYFGPHIESYVERKEVTKDFKVYSLLFLWIPTLITEIFIVKAWYLRLIPLVIVVTITMHIFQLKTVTPKKVLENADGEINQ